MRKARVIQRMTTKAVVDEQYQPRPLQSGTPGLAAVNGRSTGFPNTMAVDPLRMAVLGGDI